MGIPSELSAVNILTEASKPDPAASFFIQVPTIGGRISRIAVTEVDLCGGCVDYSPPVVTC